MLETASLLLPSWAPDRPDPRTWTRAILDARTGEPLGVAQLRRLPFARWLPWPARWVLAVFETEDESLLCTLRRIGWFRRGWAVFDADGRLVGAVQRDCLSQVVNHRASWVQREPQSDGERFLSLNGREIAHLGHPAGQTVLKFEADSTVSPFVRMLILAAVLGDDAPG
jgi:hypothetical protein